MDTLGTRSIGKKLMLTGLLCWLWACDQEALQLPVSKDLGLLPDEGAEMGPAAEAVPACHLPWIRRPLPAHLDVQVTDMWPASAAEIYLATWSHGVFRHSVGGWRPETDLRSGGVRTLWGTPGGVVWAGTNDYSLGGDSPPAGVLWRKGGTGEQWAQYELPLKLFSIRTIRSVVWTPDSDDIHVLGHHLSRACALLHLGAKGVTYELIPQTFLVVRV
jgi:hypothetical protein